MADISINKFTSVVKLQGNSASVPSLPPSLEDTPPAVNPPGTGINPSASTFLQLTDTPASYTGQAGLFPRVNSGETGLEFASAIGGTIASGQVAFGTGVNTIGGDAGLVWDNTGKQLSVVNPVSRGAILISGSNRSDFFFVDSGAGTDLKRILFRGDGGVLTFGAENDAINTFFSRITLNLGFAFGTNPSGVLGILTTAPTNTLDVNGTARIRTLSNATGDFVTASATGVLQKRTAAEVVSDLGITGSNWTVIGSDIYRNSKVLVGATSFTDTGAKFEVSGRISQVGTGNSIFIGQNAGVLDDLTTNNNVYIGTSAGASNIVGNSNVAIGIQSLNLSTASQNTAIGYRSARLATTGNSFVSIGFENCDDVTTASRFVSIGWNATYLHTTGGFFTAVGYQAARSNTTGTRFTAIGYNSGFSQQTGNDWMAIGYQAGQNNNSSNSNWIAIGNGCANQYSGGTTDATTFSNGVYLGNSVKVGGSGATNEIVIGYQAEGQGSNTVVLGNSSIILTILRGTVNMAGLPTSSAGLNAGDVWNNGGVLNIV